eukprot:m.137851 g.137851  ORF g.137851 m.137851 type:complete len:214 (-) comp17008_c0_seq2:47-688(-)
MAGLCDVVRRLNFFFFTAMFLADTIAHPETLQHLTLWTMALHSLYWSTSPPDSGVSTFELKRLHGMAFCGAHAVLAAYCWLLFWNPTLELDLADKWGNSHTFAWVRSFFLHVFPVVAHYGELWAYRQQGFRELVHAQPGGLHAAWSALGFFAFVTLYEQFFPQATDTYNIKGIDNATFIIGAKACALVSTIVAFAVLRNVGFGAKTGDKPKAS